MDLETALLATVPILGGAIALLWSKVDKVMTECAEERAKCEQELRRLWTRVDNKFQSERIEK